MTTARVKTYRDGDNDVVLIPREMSFGEGVELVLERDGDVLTIHRHRPTIADLVAALDKLPAPDYVEVRDVEPLPEREGL
jgi:antitoxin VapB